MSSFANRIKIFYIFATTMQQTNNIQPTPSHPLAHSSWPFRHFSVSIATHHTHIYNTLYNLASHQKHLVSHTPSPLSEGEGLGVRSLPYISNNYVFLKHCNIDVKHCTFAAAIAFLEHHFHIIQTSNINNQSIVTN